MAVTIGGLEALADRYFGYDEDYTLHVLVWIRLAGQCSCPSLTCHTYKRYTSMMATTLFLIMTFIVTPSAE
jgi:hypothetical protein